MNTPAWGTEGRAVQVTFAIVHTWTSFIPTAACLSTMLTLLAFETGPTGATWRTAVSTTRFR